MSKSPILPFFARSLGADLEQMGFIAAASTIPGILVSTPVGVLVDRKGPKLMLWTAGIFFALVPFLYLFVTLPVHLLVVRFVHGFATAILGPVALAVVASWYGEQRGERMAWYSSSTRVGRMLAPLVGGTLLILPIFGMLGFTGYQSVYLVCGLLGLVALGFTAVLPISTLKEPAQLAASKERKADTMLRPVLTRVVLLVCVAEAATYFIFGAFEFFMPLFWVDVTGLPEWITGPLLTLFIATLLVSAPILGVLSDRWGRRGFIIAGLISLCLLIILQVSVPNPLIQIGLVVPAAVAMAAIVTSTSPLITEVVDASFKGTALGLLSMIMDVGQTLGPICVSLLLIIGGQSYTFAFTTISSILLLIPLFLILWLHPTRPIPPNLGKSQNYSAAS